MARNEEFMAWGVRYAHGDAVLDDGHPLPILTLLLYRVCENDLEKFTTVVDAMQAAFEAGQRHAAEGIKRSAGTTRSPTAGRT